MPKPTDNYIHKKTKRSRRFRQIRVEPKEFIAEELTEAEDPIIPLYFVLIFVAFLLLCYFMCL